MQATSYRHAFDFITERPQIILHLLHRAIIAARGQANINLFPNVQDVTAVDAGRRFDVKKFAVGCENFDD